MYAAKSSHKRPPFIVLSHGPLREPILVSDQLQLRPLFWIPEVVAYESFDCNKPHIKLPEETQIVRQFLLPLQQTSNQDKARSRMCNTV